MTINYCPWCMAKIDISIMADGKIIGAEAGDYTMCNYCGNFSMYDENKVIHKTTTDDLDDKMFKEMLILKIEWLNRRKT